MLRARIATAGAAIAYLVEGDEHESGEGDDEQRIDIAGFSSADEMSTALSEDGGFSGAGGGADEDAVTDGFDAAALGVGPGLGGGGHDVFPIFSTSC